MINFTKNFIFLFFLLFVVNFASAQQLFGANPDLRLGRIYDDAQGRSLTKNSIPSSLDNRHLFPEIKNQAGCGSCTIFAATALLEAAIQRDYGVPVGPLDRGVADLKEQFSIDCGFPLNGCSAGWTLPLALSSLIEFGGTSWSELSDGRLPKFATTEHYKPQRAQCSSYINYLQSNRQVYKFRPFEYVKYSPPSLDALKSAINNYGAVATAMYWAKPISENNVLRFTRVGCTSSNCGGHAIVIVGYDDARRAFLIRNSWGLDAPYSEEGYQWISYDEYSPNSASKFVYRDQGFYVIQRRVELPAEVSPTILDVRPRVSVVLRGDGAGVVESIVGPALSCSPVCMTTAEVGQTIRLRALPNSGSVFTRWDGCNSIAGGDCLINVSRDVSVAANFSVVQFGSEFDPALITLLGDKAQSLINLPAEFLVNKRGDVVPRGIKKLDTLMLEDTTVVMDPSFVVDGGRYSSSTNDAKSALVIKYLQVPTAKVPSNGFVEITFKRANPTNLTGGAGAQGSNGGNGASKGTCGGSGNVGGVGLNGGKGSSGKSRQYDSVVAISIGTVIDSRGRVIPGSKIKFNFDFGGYDGGNGGNGGRGGNGGNGGGGGSGRSGLFGCECGPGNGGNGGNGGVGGDAGDGGDAGFGANLALFIPQEYLSSVNGVNVGEGLAGRKGVIGLNGSGGSGGARGSRPGVCTGGENGRSGTSPAPISPGARDGLLGGVGDFLYASLRFTQEHSMQLSSVGSATDFLKSEVRLLDAQLLPIQKSQIGVTWTDLNPELGSVVVSLKKDGLIIASRSVDQIKPSVYFPVATPGLYMIEAFGLWQNASEKLFSIPVLLPGRDLVANGVGAIWSMAGGRSAEEVVAKLDDLALQSNELVDVYVASYSPSAGWLLKSGGNWIPISDFSNANMYKYLEAKPLNEVGLIQVVSGEDLSNTGYDGTQFFVGYGRLRGSTNSFGALLADGTFFGPFVLRSRP